MKKFPQKSCRKFDILVRNCILLLQSGHETSLQAPWVLVGNIPQQTTTSKEKLKGDYTYEKSYEREDVQH